MEKEHFYNVLIVSSSESFNEGFKKFLPENKNFTVTFQKSVNSAQRLFLERKYDIVIINAPLPDDFGLKFAVDVSSGNFSVAIIFVKSENYPEIAEKVKPYGVFVCQKPSPEFSIYQTVDHATATVERLKKMTTKTQTLQEKMQELKLINRAKWMLIDSLKMTETDAHRYLEKQAMDRCITKKEMAEIVIKTYS